MVSMLQKLREEKNETTADVAKYLGIEEWIYVNYEINPDAIPLSVLLRLREHYQTNLDYLLELTEASAPYPLSNPQGKGNKDV